MTFRHFARGLAVAGLALGCRCSSPPDTPPTTDDAGTSDRKIADARYDHLATDLGRSDLHLGFVPVDRLSLGGMHTCGLLVDKTVRCWGSNERGQVGGKTADKILTPTPIGGLSNVTQLVAGGVHNCALFADGTAKCWGSAEAGRLGDGSTTGSQSTPVTVAGLTGIKQISCGAEHTCALFAGGTVKCWGQNFSGQLGDGQLKEEPKPVPQPVKELAGAAQISLGGWHSCALLQDGTAKCWGDNTRGQLGDGTNKWQPLPSKVQGLSNAKEISSFGNQSCALLQDGTVKCWGWNSHGQCGDGTTVDRNTAVSVVGLTNVSQLSVGDGHVCVLLADKTVKCWGTNYDGAVGDGTVDDRHSPTPVPGLAKIGGIGMGGRHSCAILDDRHLMCWGLNASGELGDGTQESKTSPAAVAF